MKRREFIFGSAIGLIGSTMLPAIVMANANDGNLNDDLPKVLILGDSISIGYFPYVKEFLKGKANVNRPFKSDGAAENCQGTTNGIKNIDRWIGDTKWDIIHFNFGLHDIKHVDAITGKNSEKLEDPRQAEPKQYKKNLRMITDKLKTASAKIVFATTTPFPENVGGPLREYGDAEKYNKIALKIMKRNNVQVNDLFGFVLPRMSELQRPNNVHFTDEGSKALAEQVSKIIIG